MDEYILLDNYPEPIYCEVYDLAPMAELPLKHSFVVKMDIVNMIYHRDLLRVCNYIYVPSHSEWINICCFNFNHKL